VIGGVIQLLKRPIAVWVIFGYSVIVAVIAIWAAIPIWLAMPGTPGADVRDEYGVLGLAVSLIPASILLLAGLSLFMLKRWTAWLFGLNVLIFISSIYVDTSALLISTFWLTAATAVFAYTIWLRYRGVLL
jgi:hypothetical protein